VSTLLAGRDTTACTLSWLFYEFAYHPEVGFPSQSFTLRVPYYWTFTFDVVVVVVRFMGSRGTLFGRRLMVGLPEVEGGGVADFGGGWETYL
jgi:hypothetical protein